MKRNNSVGPALFLYVYCMTPNVLTTLKNVNGLHWLTIRKYHEIITLFQFMIKSGFHFKQSTFTKDCQTQQLIHWCI